MDSIFTVLISHQPPAALQPVLGYWQKICAPENLLLAYGGAEGDFQALNYSPKLFIFDPRLRTVDHQREQQSYTGIVNEVAASQAFRESDCRFVYLVEYDHLPIVPDLGRRLIDTLRQEEADVIGHHLRRVDQTNDPHYLFHLSDARFANYWQQMSQRAEAEVVLSMFGSGSFWTREAFAAVAGGREPFPIYLEIYLPTLAHHLGYRVRDYGEQNRFVHNLGDLNQAQIAEAQATGAWTLHPVKQISEAFRL